MKGIPTIDLNLEVLQVHIDQGLRNHRTRCPKVLSLQDALPEARRITVSGKKQLAQEHWQLRCTVDGLRYAGMLEAVDVERIDRYDAGGTMVPHAWHVLLVAMRQAPAQKAQRRPPTARSTTGAGSWRNPNVPAGGS